MNLLIKETQGKFISSCTISPYVACNQPQTLMAMKMKKLKKVIQHHVTNFHVNAMKGSVEPKQSIFSNITKYDMHIDATYELQ